MMPMHLEIISRNVKLSKKQDVVKEIASFSLATIVLINNKQILIHFHLFCSFIYENRRN